ncbi:MAG: DUF2188 domain-containing protein [Reyranella sp.]|jgi:hypothetical protein|nr:DUF2188 domain-containing protein [Reyranella sp.]
MPKNDRFVVRHGNDWAVKAGRARRVSGVYATQGEAEQAAKAIVRNLGGGEVRIQGRDGRWRDLDSHTSSVKSSKGAGGIVTKSTRTPTGRVVWRVTDKNGRQLTLTTSRTSNAVIQEGASIYNEALKSLAKR